MNKKSYKSADDLKGAGQLAVDGVVGLTNIVEALHFTIVRLGGLRSGENHKRMKGLTGFIYNLIRAITVMTGYGVDRMLDKLQTQLGEKVSTQRREVILSIINGVLGDYLDRKSNPLSIKMSFRKEGAIVDGEAIKHQFDEISGESKLLIMVHGLCMNDLQWNRKGRNHGEMLAEIGDFIPNCLDYYNSGRHISENGEDFSELLEELFVELNRNIEIVIVTHSMGGLVTRSAIHQAELKNYKWFSAVSKLVFLGTPHKGAALERGGNWFETVLDSNPYSAPLAKLGTIRSAGITDMRYVNLTKEDWHKKDRFDNHIRPINHIPLPKKIECFSIAASTAKKEHKVKDNLIGDGLVSINSAFGVDKDPRMTLYFPETNKHLIRGINHMDLLDNEEVLDCLKAICL